MENLISLNRLNPQQKGTVRKIRGEGEVHQRLLDMGITNGAEIEAVKVAPLGDPIDVKIKGYHLSLRKNEAANIFVEIE